MPKIRSNEWIIAFWNITDTTSLRFIKFIPVLLFRKCNFPFILVIIFVVIIVYEFSIAFFLHRFLNASHLLNFYNADDAINFYS